jgi:hypothetical protein
MLRDEEMWLVEESLTDSAEPGLTFAARLCRPAAFAMTCGVVVPSRRRTGGGHLFGNMTFMRRTDQTQLANDPRLVAAIGRSALNARIVDHGMFRETMLAVS